MTEIDYRSINGKCSCPDCWPVVTAEMIESGKRSASQPMDEGDLTNVFLGMLVAKVEGECCVHS